MTADAQDRDSQTPETEMPGDPKPGDILLFRDPRRTRDYLIKFITHSQFFHAALYAGDNHVIEARPQGVIYNDLAGRDSDIFIIPGPKGKGQEALEWAKTQLGDPFDKMDMLVIAMERIFANTHLNYRVHGKYTCAGLIATSYHAVGVELCPGRELDEVAPGDLAPWLPADARPYSLKD